MQAQLCPEAIRQEQVQQAFACPELNSGSLQICIQWLEDRKSLLKAEQSALQLLPPTTYQLLREKVGSITVFIYKLQLHERLHVQFVAKMRFGSAYL